MNSPSRKNPLISAFQKSEQSIASWWQPHVWLYLPAYLALMVALGAACRALAHFITNADVTFYLWLALIINCFVSFGIQCGGAKLRHWSSNARVFLFLLLPFAAFVFNSTVLAPLEAEAEINATVSLVVGWSAIISVLLIGIRYGERRFPLAAPLIPGLSLFGLLNSLSVDTLVQICFLVFVAGSLYLMVYEPMLHRHDWNRKASQDTETAPAPASPTATSRRRVLPAFLSRAAIGRTAAGYLAACSVWFAAFLGGAALFYYPVEAILPRVMSAPLGAVRGASAALLDWRGSSPVMELRGGNYPLSERVVMQVELRQEKQTLKSSPVLWRGRIYEEYETSRWTEIQKEAPDTLVRRGPLTEIARDARGSNGLHPVLAQAREPLSVFSPQLVRRYEIEAYIQPERVASSALYFPGDLAAVQGLQRRIIARANGTYSLTGFFYNHQPYAIRAQVKDERLSGLAGAAGLSPALLEIWKKDEDLARTLQVSPELRAQLAPIIRQIKSSLQRGGQNYESSTPYARASAVRDYLYRNCTYSLSSPLVPATQDAVVFFLTKSKRGACDMFASSMVLLLRAMDVPARLATGYIEPEELTGGRVTTAGTTINSPFARDSSESFGFNPSRIDSNATTLTFELRERDAHAWVEYFIPHAGWLTYDPTAGTRTTEIALEDQIASMFSLPSLQIQWRALWLPLCGLLLVCSGLIWSYVDLRQRQHHVAKTAADITCAQIAATYNQALRLLHRRVPRAAHLTPQEYEASVNRAAIPHEAKQEFAGLTYLLNAARYTSAPPAISQDDLQASLQRLRRALRQNVKHKNVRHRSV